MILTDGVHLVSDFSVEELHRFAYKVGLKREWFQFHKRHPHYDITTKRMLSKVLRMGVKQVSTRELIRLINGK